jgi:drug/metabolite transporter (DMT)-like permease
VTSLPSGCAPAASALAVWAPNATSAQYAQQLALATDLPTAIRGDVAAKPRKLSGLTVTQFTLRYDSKPMKHQPPSRRLLAIGLALAILLDTVGQLLWKVSIASVPFDQNFWSTVESVLRQPLFIVLAAIFLCQLFNWLRVLERADLSYAQPITSLSYVTVCALSAVLLGEHIGTAKVAGVVCVLAGVVLVSRSPPLERESGN